MTHALAIARREVQERSFVFIAAVAFALIPLAIAALPYGGSPAEKIGTIGGIFAVGFTAGLAATLGGSIVGRDLSSGKLSFYYARPVSAASIWFGKILGAAALLVGSFVITFLPVLMVQQAWFETWNVDLRSFATIVLGGSLLLMLVAHAVSTMVRSRSWLIAVDFVLLFVALAALGLLLTPLMLAFALETVAGITGAVVIAAILAVLPAGFWQLSRGRSDRFRSHLAMSTFLWSAIAVILVVALGVSLYIRSAGPEDLTAVDRYDRSPSGSTVIFGGRAQGRGDYVATFAGDLATGKYRPAPATLFYDPVMSADGKTLLFTEPSDVLRQMAVSIGLASRRADNRVFELSVASLDDMNTRRSVTRISPRDDFALSPDGRRVAVIGREAILSLYDAQEGRLLASAKLPAGRHEGRWTPLIIPSDNVVRAYVVQRDPALKPDQPGMATIRIFELDASTRTLTETGTVPYWGRQAGVIPVSGGRAIVRSFYAQGAVPPSDAPPAVRLVDGRTGATLIGAAASVPGARVGSARLLQDGRMAVVENRDKQYFVRVLDPAGNPGREVPLGNAASVRLEGEAAAGVLIVSSVGEENSFGATFVKPWTVRAVDVNRGTVLHQHDQLRVITASWSGISSGAITPVIPCLDKDRRLVRWNAVTNAVEPIVWKKG